MATMMLRVVDLAEFEHGTNDNPAGVYWVQLPPDYDQMQPEAQQEWCAQAAAETVPSPRRNVWEVVDAELPDYAREKPPLPDAPAPEPGQA